MIPGKKFDKKFFSTGAYKNYKSNIAEWVEPRAKRIYRLLRNNPSAEILDVGCGFGNLIAELQNKYNFSVHGLDLSSYAIEKADPSVRKKIKMGNILKLPFKKNSFDLVICFDVIYYLTPKETIKAIKNLIRVTREYIFFNSIYRHSRWASQKQNPDPLRVTTLSEKDYINIFSQNGAKLVEKFYCWSGGDILVFKKFKK